MQAVVINDDVAVEDSLYTAGRRGVGTTVLAEKIVGAAAEEKRPLNELAELCHKVNAQGRRSIGARAGPGGYQRHQARRADGCTTPHLFSLE